MSPPGEKSHFLTEAVAEAAASRARFFLSHSRYWTHAGSAFTGSGFFYGSGVAARSSTQNGISGRYLWMATKKRSSWAERVMW
jgi:hypothetical protein